MGCVFLQGLEQDAFEGVVVGRLVEQRQPGHGAIERVVDITARRVACSLRHAAERNRTGLAWPAE